MTIYTIEQRIAAGSQFTGTNGGSTGSITTVAGNLLVQGETFKLRARKNDIFTFVFDKTGTLVSDGLTRIVQVTDAMTSTQVRDAIITAINRTPGLALFASAGGASTVTLLNALGGTAGDLAALPDTVVNAGFVVSALTGGAATPAVTELEGTRMFAESTFGGLFDFDFTLRRLVEGAASSRPAIWKVERLFAQFTSAGTYTVAILQPDGVAATVQTGAGAVILITNPILLAGDERLSVTTSGASAAMYARVTARPSA